MKNGFYFLGGLLLLAGACTAPDSYRLVGNLSGLADGTRMLLVPAATHKQEKPIGEAVVEDGKFVFEVVESAGRGEAVVLCLYAGKR